MVTLKPETKRLKQLVKAHGPDWQLTEFRPYVACFGGPGAFIRSQDGKHTRWVEPHHISMLDRVSVSG